MTEAGAATGTAVTEAELQALVGHRFPGGRVRLEPYDPIHLDPAAVRALGMGDRVVNQAPISIGYVQNMLIAWSGGADRIRGLRLRFLARVLGGDRVVAGGEVTAVDGENGTVGCEVWLDVVDRAGSDSTLPVRAALGTAAVLPPAVPGISGVGTAGPG